jgi:CBS domain-containing protein
MRHTIMTEKIARRGVRVPSEYAVDYLDRVVVGERASRPVATIGGHDTVAAARTWLAAGEAAARHQAFPVVDAGGLLEGVVTRRELLDASLDEAKPVRELVRRPPAVVFDDCSLREAADHMLLERVGRLPVVTRAEPRKVIGIITRSDLLEAHARRLDETHRAERAIATPLLRGAGRRGA